MAVTNFRKIAAGVLLLSGMSFQLSARQQTEQVPAAMENSLEREAAATDRVSEDDAQWQQLNALATHPIQLNKADEADLQSIGLLTPLQISSFLQYRALLGNLVSIYELQAVPGFEPEVIRRILPYVYVGDDLEPHYTLRDYMRKGEHTFLLRASRQLEKSRGYLRTDSTLPAYRGSPEKMFIRYRYSFPRHCSWGVTMEKDPGEALFKGAQRQGFDFYSAHLFVRNRHRLKALALGDYSVNLGQGLLNWQGQAYGKGAAVMQIKKEGDVLKPYTSPGEFYFFRGAAATLQYGRWEATVFVSYRRLDGSTDTLMEEITTASLNSSGYHRTLAESAKKGAISAVSTGGNVQFNNGRWRIGANIINHRFTPILQKKTAPYNQFDFNSGELTAASIDYAAGWKNVHFFGEMAMSANGKPAILQGLMTSVAPAADVALLYRYYDRAYQSMYAKGFGESYRTSNEQGIYSAISLKVSTRLKLDAYADVFSFPWLKYRANAPSAGKDFLVQATYIPGRQMAILLRYNQRQGAENTTLPGNPIRAPGDITSTHIRLQYTVKKGRQLEAKTRLEYSAYRDEDARQSGWMIYQEADYHFRRLPFSITGRLTSFRTSDYSSRIYATESSVLYENAVSQLYGNGWQYYLNVKWKVNRQLACWARFHQSVYPGQTKTGSGNDLIYGNKKTVIQFQIQYLLSHK
ncbi:helix-hairpin-helix domain-containing protein [Chitinophaga sp. 212800010-3]|uniref:ComEA family DNA-binding protein n=1 Tax=unclassified Chitinophaga TaxID=2619133 RepID=UPI002DE39BED|nr:Helix-hairpin-helix domain-containing protein [Chitinophaga sp. 212800010-3]